MTRRYARAPRGERVIEHTPAGHWQTTTMVAALRHDCVEAPLALEGAMDSVVFRGYVERMLLPTLRRGDVVVMDNLSSHKGAIIQQLIETADAEVRYLPPYSPDFNPIEAMWSKAKQSLRSARARNGTSLVKAIGSALRSVTAQDCAGFYRGYGYTATR